MELKAEVCGFEWGRDWVRTQSCLAERGASPRFSLPSPGKADLSAVRGLSSAMGIGMSLLLQFSLTSGGYQSVGRSRRCGRSFPRKVPTRSWKPPRPQLRTLQGRVWPFLCPQTNPSSSVRVSLTSRTGADWGRKESRVQPAGAGVIHVASPPEESWL